MSPHHDNVCYVWSWLMVDSIDDWWGWLVLWWQTSTKYKDAEKRCIEHFLGIFTVIITHNIDVFSCIILFFFTHHRPHVSIKRQMTQKRCWFWEIIYILVQDFSSSIFHLVSCWSLFMYWSTLDFYKLSFLPSLCWCLLWSEATQNECCVSYIASIIDYLG